MYLSIQAGRAIAAIAVMAFHLSLMVGNERYLGHTLYEAFTARGHIGVEYFFVLSGFIIFVVHEKDIGRPERWLGYLKKRILRLHPQVWIYTSLMCLLLAGGFQAYTHLPANAAQWISTYSLIRLDNFQPPIGPTWTLFHEFGFNLTFSLLILNRWLGIAALAIWTVGALANFQYAPEDQLTAFNTYFSAQNIEFILGIGAYYLFKHGGRGLLRAALMLGIAITAINGWIDWHGIEYPLLLAVYALGFGLIIAGLAAYERDGGRLWLPGAKLLGDASYSIYLTHVMVMESVLKLAAAAKLADHIGGPGVYALAFAAGLGLGLLAFRFIETPLMAWIRRVSEPERSPQCQ